MHVTSQAERHHPRQVHRALHGANVNGYVGDRHIAILREGLEHGAWFQGRLPNVQKPLRGLMSGKGNARRINALALQQALCRNWRHPSPKRAEM